MRYLKLRFSLSIIISVSVLVGFFWVIGIETVVESVRAISLIWLFPIFCLQIIVQLVRSFRWRLILRPLKKSIKTKNLIGLMMIGSFVNMLIPVRLGDFLRGYILTKTDKIRFFSGVSTILAEKVLDVFGIVLIALTALLLIPPQVKPPPMFVSLLELALLVSLIVLSLIAFGIKNRSVPLRITDLITTIFPHKLRLKLKKEVELIIDGFIGLYNNIQSFLAILSLSIVIWALQVIILILFFNAFSYNVSMSLIALGGMIHMLSFMIPAPPINTGTYEAYWTFIFKLLGLDAGIVFSIGLVSHWFSVFLTTVMGLAASSWLGVNLLNMIKIRNFTKAQDMD